MKLSALKHGSFPEAEYEIRDAIRSFLPYLRRE